MGTSLRTQQGWMSYQCACGFRLARVPLSVMSELPRCLGCGKAPRPPRRGGLRGVANVRDLR